MTSNMRKVVIFGGTGMTGLCAVEAALKKGLEVRALARNPNRFPDHIRSKLEIVRGDVLDLNDVRNAVKGVDGVVIALGQRNDFRPTTTLSDGTKNVLVAMKEAGIKPVSVCLSYIDKVFKMFQEVTKDHQRMLEALQTSDLDWVAVLPPRIEGGPLFAWNSVVSLPSVGFGYGVLAAVMVCLFPVLWLSSKISGIFKTPETGPSGNYEIKYGSSPGKYISKYDLGYFLVDCLDKPEHYHQLVGIARRS